jgi:hypothetical protein
MARIQLKDLYANLDWAREQLLQVAEKDGMVSRQDFRELVDQLDDTSQVRFLEMLYQFFRKLEDRPRMRVTRSVIENGVAYIRDHVLPEFEIADFFTTLAKQDIAKVHDYALPLANQLRRAAEENKGLTAEDVALRIAAYTEGLFFDDFGSESSESIEAYYQAANLTEMTPESFAAALDLDQSDPTQKITTFTEADEVFMVFIDQHFRFGTAERAIAIVDLMRANLTDLYVVILGADDQPGVSSKHPTYVVGLGKDGSMAGFTTNVVWT